MNETSCKIKLANLIIEIEKPNAYLLDKCKNYIVSAENTDIFIEKIHIAEIKKEREIAKRQRKLDNLPEIKLEDDYLEYINVYRRIAEQIPNYGMILLHGAAVSIDDKAYIFIAKSGVGKTTHIMNWIKSFPGAIVINGDKPIIDTVNMTACGTPWAGKEQLHTNIQVPIAGICILERGEINQIFKIEAWDAVKNLTAQTYWPTSLEMRKKTIKLLDKLREISFYSLSCTADIESARISYEAMHK